MGNDLMLVVCSDDPFAATVIETCEPAVVLQKVGGLTDPDDVQTRATFEYAVAMNEVRNVIVCGHRSCHAGDERAESRAAVVARCESLREDAFIGGLLRDYEVGVHALWIDDHDGGVYVRNDESDAFMRLDDAELHRWCVELRRPIQ